MKLKIIALLLGIIIGGGIFIYQQFQEKTKFRNEIAVINKKIHEKVIEESNNIPESLIMKTKQEVIDMLKRDEYILIKDYFYAFENFYDTIKRHEKYGKLIKTKEFLETDEYKNIEKLKTAILVSEIVQDGKRRSVIGIPENIDCSKYELKAPCIKNKERVDIEKTELIFVKKDYSDDLIEKILHGELKLFF